MNFVEKLVVSLAGLGSLNITRIDSEARYIGNFDRTRDNEIVEVSSQASKTSSKNTVQVYGRSSGGRYRFEVAFGKEEAYSIRGKFEWSGAVVNRVAMSDFDRNGFIDAIFYNGDSDLGMMLTYDSSADRFLMVPVRIEHQGGE